MKIKISLIVLTGLFGQSACANRFNKVSKVVSAFTKMPASYDAWCRQQLSTYWDKNFIDVKRRKNITSKTLKLVKLEEGSGGIAGLFSPSIDTIALRLKGPLCLAKYKNNIDGNVSQTLAHEYVHFAKDFSDVPINKELSSLIFETLSKNKKMCFYAEKTSDITCQSDNHVDASPIVNHAERHCEFFCDLKGLELVEQGDSIACQAFLKDQYKRYINNVLGRDDNYPDAHEFLLCWSLYKQLKNKHGILHDPSDSLLHNLIDEFLEHRDLYKKTMMSIQFLKTFDNNRSASLLYKLIGSLFVSDWNHDAFIEVLNKDAMAVEKIVQCAKFDRRVEESKCVIRIK